MILLEVYAAVYWSEQPMLVYIESPQDDLEYCSGVHEALQQPVINIFGKGQHCSASAMPGGCNSIAPWGAFVANCTQAHHSSGLLEFFMPDDTATKDSTAAERAASTATLPSVWTAQHLLMIICPDTAVAMAVWPLGFYALFVGQGMFSGLREDCRLGRSETIAMLLFAFQACGFLVQVRSQSATVASMLMR